MKKNIIMTAALALLLAGCSTSELLKSTEPQQTIYTLRPVEPSGLGSAAAARVVEITAPTLPPGMDSDRYVLFLDDGQKLDYFAAARWSAPLDYIVQDVTRRSASAVQPYIVATTPGQGVDPDYRLQMKVNEFQPVYGADSMAAPTLKVSIEFTLVAVPEDKIVSSFTLTKHDVAAENRLDGITSGLEHMLQEIEREAFMKLDPKLRAPKV